GQTLINNSLFTLAQLQALGGVTQQVTYTAPDGSTQLGVTPGQVNMGWFRATDVKFSWVGHIKERFTIEPSVGFFNVFNFSNFDSAGNALVGTLSGTNGSINNTVHAGRPARIGACSGAFNFGAPPVI